jgi:NADH dehydrogenase
VSAITASQVTVRTGRISERIDARTVLWAAGTRPTTFGRRVAAELGATVDGTGRIAVNADLSVPGHPDVLVIGDLAEARRPDGSPVPAVAQGGIQGGRHVGRVVGARLRGLPAPAFRYRDKGELAMIGRFRTVARLPHVRLAGPIAWLVWLGVHLFYLQGFQNRVLVGVRWLWTMLSGERATRLITGPPGPVGSRALVGLLGDGAALDMPLPGPVVAAGRSRSVPPRIAQRSGHARDPHRRPVTSSRLGGSHW